MSTISSNSSSTTISSNTGIALDTRIASGATIAPKTMTPNATLSLYPQQNAAFRLFALWYFMILMTLWNIAGHTFLGFEQAWIHPIVAVLTAG